MANEKRLTNLINSTVSKIENKLINLEKRIWDLEAKRSNWSQFTFEKISSDEVKQVDQSPDKLRSMSVGHQLADSVTSIVGLKETIFSKHHVTKWIWAILFSLGISATIFFMYQTTIEYLANPTATRVQLSSQADHEFPPLLLCPKTWFDAEKALSLGMSLDALKYSLSYPETANFHLVNVSEAKEEFLFTYTLNDFKSLLDYYKAISPDLDPDGSDNSSDTSSTYICHGCDETRIPGKTILEHRLCHVFYLKSIEPGFGMYAGFRRIHIHYRTKTLGLIPENFDWELYFSPTMDAFIPIYPKVMIKPFTSTTVKFHEQRYITMPSKEAPCQLNEKDDNYTAITCMAKCHNDMYQKALNCRLIWLSFLSSESQPTDICNFLDRYTLGNLSLHEFFQSDQNKNIDALASTVCVKRCPRECDRMIFDATMQLQTKFLDEDKHVAIDANMTIIALTIQHAAVYQGGLMVLREMSTYSFTELVNNIGGTLGLFVGGTVMTFAQLILFVIDYFCGTKKKQGVLNT